MHDDDFDRRRTGGHADIDIAAERARVPGKQTLVEAQHRRSMDAHAVAGKRTLVQDLPALSGSVAEERDPIVETEFHVRKAREAIAALQKHPSPAQDRLLRADLRCHLDDAERAAARCLGHERGHDAVSSVFQLIMDVRAIVGAPGGHHGDAAATTTPVQRKAAGSPAAGKVDEIARAGTAGAGGALPHLDQVQASFGRHDVSRIRSHVGGAAADSSEALGANAYAYGDAVAFGSAPDLHTAAHEAAHVVQQRGGVQLSGGIDGGANDPYERHADEVADRVVAGGSAEALLDEHGGAGGAPVLQRKLALAKTPALPQGTRVARVRVDISVLAEAARAQISAHASVEADLIVTGSELVVAVTAGTDVWTASLSADDVLTSLVGDAETRSALAKELGSALAFLESLPHRVKPVGTRLRVGLGGENFVVLDVGHIVHGVSEGNLSGLRPVEAQLLLGKAGGVRVVGNDLVKAQTAMPGAPIGGWFELPEDPHIRAIVGVEAPAVVWGGVFYEHGVIRVGLKPNKDAQTGVVAHIDLMYLVDKLASFGDKLGDWVAKLAARIKSGALDFFHVISGRIHLELPDVSGTWFDFDLKLQLPQLFSGGGFHLGHLLPSSFHISLPKLGLSLGAMPKLKFPWLTAPPLGGFHVPWDRLSKLLGSVSMPKLPDIELDLHLAGKFSLGLGVDLSAAWPELRDLALGFELDLQALLANAKAAGQWISSKLHAAADFAHTWIHLGGDGVLRIYDRAQPDGPMVGFHLLKLLDGANAADLLPTEMRWNPPAGAATIEMGEVASAAPSKDAPTGKAAPQKPSGAPLARKPDVSPPPSVIERLALAKGAKVDVELFQEGERLTVWAAAASALYAHGQAIKASVSIKQIEASLTTHLQATKRLGHGDRPPIAFDAAGSLEGPRFAFGTAVPTAVGLGGKVGKVGGHAMWKLDQLLAADQWTDLIPQFDFTIDGAGGIVLGDFKPPGASLGGRFALESPFLRHELLHLDDQSNTVWLDAYHVDDVLAVSVSSDEKSSTGALAQIHISFLLQQLERLGEVGKRMLEKLAAMVKLPSGSGGGLPDLHGLGAAIGRLLEFVKGVLAVDLGGGNFLRWNLHAQLPNLGLELDLGRLIPEFHLPALPSLSISLRPTADFLGKMLGAFSLPDLHLRDLLSGIPNLHLPETFHFVVHQLGDLFSVSIDLGNLFGDGPRSFGFEFPLDAIVNAVKKAGGWLGHEAKDIASYVHIGNDGVLRVFKDANGDRVGFDLLPLFRGVSFESLVPSELHLAVGAKDASPAVDIAIGDDRVTAAKQRDSAAGGRTAGKVLVPRPKSEAIAEASMTAPEWLSEHLGVAPNAKLHASLHLERNGDAVAFASVDGSDRGAEIVLHARALEQMVVTGPVKVDTKHLSIDHKASRARGMLVVSLGNAGGAHGHVGWKLQRLLSSPTLASLVPDEAEVGVKGASLTVARELDLSGLAPQGSPISLAGWDWATQALHHNFAQVYANALVPDARIALVASDGKQHEDKPIGVELHVDKHVVTQIQHRLKDLAGKASSAIQQAIRRAGVQKVSVAAVDTRLEPTAAGILLEHGRPNDPSYMYARFGWQHVAELAGGQISIDALVPDDFRVATKSMAIEVRSLDVAVGKPPPTAARQIGQLHPLLRDSLTAFGLSQSELVDLDLDRSKVIDPEVKTVAAIGHVYDVDTAGNVTSGRQISLAISLEALLGQVLPKARTWSKKPAAPAEPEDGRTSVGASIGLHHDVAQKVDGLEMEAHVIHKNLEGKRREFQVTAGWSLQDIINLLMHLDSVIGPDGVPTGKGGGYLVPSTLVGSFQTDNFAVTFGTTTNKFSRYHCKASDIGLDTLLGMVMDAGTAAECNVHLFIPNATQVAKQFADAVANPGKFVTMVGCALEVPKAGEQSHWYGIDLGLSPKIFKNLLYLIPELGPLLKIADVIKDVAKHPVQTLEALRYSPEAMIDIAENAPEIYDTIKEKGFGGIAMALVTHGDVSTKQAVMAARIKKKLPKDWKPGDPKPKGLDPNIPADYLEWLSKQDSQALADLFDLAEQEKQKGLEIGDVDYSIPDHLLSRAEIEDKSRQIAAGYTAFAKLTHDAQAAHNEQEAKAAQAKLDQAAGELRGDIQKLIKSGARASVNTEQGGKSVDKQANVDPHEDYSDVSQIPTPEPEQEAVARKLFTTDDKGEVMSMPKVDYLTHKYAGLSVDQLGELLSSGSTILTTEAGKKVAIPMAEAERPFVRTLFLRKSGMSHADKGKGKDDHDKPVDASEGGTAADAKLVAGYHEKRLEAAKQAGKSARGKGKGKHAAAGDADHESDDAFDAAFDDAPAPGAGGPSAAGGKDGKALDGDAAASDAGAASHTKDARGDKRHKSDGGQDADAAQPSTAGHTGKTNKKDDDAKTEEPVTLSEFTHLPPETAQKFVNIDVASGRVTINRDYAQGIIGKTFHNASEEVVITDVKIGGYHRAGTDGKDIRQRPIVYTLQIDVQSDRTMGATQNTYHEYIYVPGEDRSHEFGGIDGTDFASRINAAVTVIGNTATVTNSAPFTVGPYTMSIKGAGDVQDEPGDPHGHSMTWVTLTVEFENVNGGSGIIRNAAGQPQVVHARERAQMRVPITRTP